jgi:hypothetical protein
MSPFNSWETKNLRATAIISCALLGFFVSYMYYSTVGSISAAASSAGLPDSDLMAGDYVAFIPLLLLIPLPFIACSGTDGERKFWPNGVFSFKEAIRGTPAGALPFMLMIICATALGVLGAYWLVLHKLPGAIFLSTIVWSTGFWVFCWSFGRWASATSFELKSARTLHLASMIVLLGLPVPFLAIIDSEQQTALWSLYPLYPLWMQSDDPWFPRLAMGVALLAIGGIIAYASNRKQKMKLSAPPVMA